MKTKSRETLARATLLGAARSVFKQIPEDLPAKSIRKRTISTTDCLLSGLAIFGLKYPSLLSFDDALEQEESITRFNLKTLYAVQIAPRDTYLRERLDVVNPRHLRGAFTEIFSIVQKGKGLERFAYMDDYYLMPVDGSGVFESKKISCESCCKKEHRDGTISYYHQILCAAIVHPEQKAVIPLAPEFIANKDGSTKNDCEYNALIRFIENFRREHPHLKVIATSDAIAARVPVIIQLVNAGMRYILSVKPGSHKSLFEFAQPICKVITAESNGLQRTYRYVNQVPLTDSDPDVLVNFLEYEEVNKKGEVLKFSWISDFELTPDSVEKIMRGGRCRWKIENETFNTLKNQGYQFEHNFGHGNQFLTQVFSMLMLLAFLIDQIAELYDALFQAALAKRKRKKRLWSRLQSLFFICKLDTWDIVWHALARGIEPMNPIIINST